MECDGIPYSREGWTTRLRINIGGLKENYIGVGWGGGGRREWLQNLSI